MESLAQELLDAIIDNIPPLHVQPCSLVGKRWRKRSQQRHFRNLIFTSESQVVRWHTNIPQDLDGIPSYPKQVTFCGFRSWGDPTLFSRVLKCFSRVKALVTFEAGVTHDKPYNAVSPREFGRELTSLDLRLPSCTLPTLISLILSFPNLKNLVIHGTKKVASVVPVPPDAIWRREALEFLELSRVPNDVMDSIARCGITSRRLNMTTGDAAMKRVLANSSETLVELALHGTWNFGFQNAEVIDEFTRRKPSYETQLHILPYPRPTAISDSYHDRGQHSIELPFHSPRRHPVLHSLGSGVILRHFQLHKFDSTCCKRYPHPLPMDRVGSVAGMVGYECKV